MKGSDKSVYDDNEDFRDVIDKLPGEIMTVVETSDFEYEGALAGGVVLMKGDEDTLLEQGVIKFDDKDDAEDAKNDLKHDLKERLDDVKVKQNGEFLEYTGKIDIEDWIGVLTIPITNGEPIIKVKAEVTVTDEKASLNIVQLEQDEVHPLQSPEGSSTAGFPGVDAVAISNNTKISYWPAEDYHGAGTYDLVISFPQDAIPKEGDMAKVIVKVVDEKGRTLATDIKVIKL